MENGLLLRPIARIHSDFPSKFGIPRQSGIVKELEATVIFEPEFRNAEALRGLSGFSYIILIWEFSDSYTKKWSPTVRPPRLGGNTRMGVFATRSPFRPNPLGLSSVKLLSIEKTENFGHVLHVGGSDLMDGTPIYDIKPYIPYADSHPDAKSGFAGEIENRRLNVSFSEELLNKIPKEKQEALINVLSLDPRPSYQNDSDRIYGMPFDGFDIRFNVSGKELTVCEVKDLKA